MCEKSENGLRIAYRTEVRVKGMRTAELLQSFRNIEQVSEACRLCPDYGRVWSCPPALPDVESYLMHTDQVYLIAVKVIYPLEVRRCATDAASAAAVRRKSYEKVKRELLITLLALENQVPRGICMGAGRCILCEACAREEQKPCRHSKWQRYSMTAFGFDFARLLEEKMDLRLLWSSEKLPEYDVAVAALFYQT